MSTSFLTLLEKLQKTNPGGSAKRTETDGAPPRRDACTGTDMSVGQGQRTLAVSAAQSAQCEATEVASTFDPSIKIIWTHADLAVMARTIAASPVVVLDLETTGLDVITDTIVGVGLAIGPDAGWYIPVRHTSPQIRQLEVARVLGALRGCLPVHDDGRVLVAHNAVFDLGMLRQAGLGYHGAVFDTMVAAHLMNPEKYAGKTCGLKYVANDLLGLPDWEIDVVDIQHRPIDGVAAYCVRDACAAFRLHGHLNDPIEERFAKIMALEMAFLPVLMTLEISKYPVDQDAARHMAVEVERETAALRAQLHEHAGHEINWRSPVQIQQFIYGTGDGCLGVPVLEKTDSGQPSTRAEVLIALASHSPMMATVARLKKLEARLSGYIAPIARNPGFIRCRYSQTVQITGRVSCLGSPNLGLVPNPEDENPIIGALPDVRELFIAPPGFTLVKLDYEGQEVAILAALAGDQGLIDAYTQGIDVHGLVAVDLFKLACGPNDVKALDRKNGTVFRAQAKCIQLGMFYGKTAYGLALELGIAKIAAQRLIDRYFENHPKIKGYLDRIVRQVQARQYVADISGRRRHFPILARPSTTRRIRQIQAAALREAKNFGVQAAGGVVLRLAAMELLQYLETEMPHGRLLTIRHDEVQILVPDDMLDTALPRLKQIAEGVDLRPYGVQIPLRAEVQAGKSWGTLKPWKTGGGH